MPFSGWSEEGPTCGFEGSGPLRETTPDFLECRHIGGSRNPGDNARDVSIAKRVGETAHIIRHESQVHYLRRRVFRPVEDAAALRVVRFLPMRLLVCLNPPLLGGGPFAAPLATAAVSICVRISSTF